MKYTCPACGFKVFDDEPGSYSVCIICNWQDDHVQLVYPGMSYGSNEQSLYEYQSNVIYTLPLEITEYKGYKRDENWRPLNINECIIPADVLKDGTDSFHCLKDTVIEYYWNASAVER